MARRFKVATLPEEVGSELDRRLKAQGFGGHAELAEWLSAQGYEISKSAVQRYSADLAERLERFRRSAEVAKALAETMPDDTGEMGDMLTRSVQAVVFEALGEMTVDPSKLKLSGVVDMVTKLNYVGVAQKQSQAELRKRIATVAEEVATQAKAGGMTKDGVSAVKALVLGLNK